MADPSILRSSIRELPLSTRTINHLEYERVRTIGHLVKKSADNLLAWRGFGQSMLREVRSALAVHGLILNGDAPVRGRQA